MDVRFLTPLGAVLALALVVPVAVLVLRERRARRVRTSLGLAQPPVRSLGPLAAALAAVPCLLGLAAMQPIVETTRTIDERTDAEVFVVADVSRSMLASSRSGSPTRLERVQAFLVQHERHLINRVLHVARFNHAARRDVAEH